MGENLNVASTFIMNTELETVPIERNLPKSSALMNGPDEESGLSINEKNEKMSNIVTLDTMHSTSSGLNSAAPRMSPAEVWLSQPVERCSSSLPSETLSLNASEELLLWNETRNETACSLFWTPGLTDVDGRCSERLPTPPSQNQTVFTRNAQGRQRALYKETKDNPLKDDPISRLNAMCDDFVASASVLPFGASSSSMSGIRCSSQSSTNSIVFRDCSSAASNATEFRWE